MPGDARVGCSGWSYRDWRGVVYPADAPPSRWFGLYAERFDTVEINNTFYRLPPPETAEGWARQAPPGFTYAVKLGQFGSHRMKLRDAEHWLPNHLDRVERLGPPLGPNLVQLPPRWRRDAARASTSSSPSRRRRCAGPSRCATGRGSTTTSTTCWPATAPRCASTTCCPTIRGSAPRPGPTSASTDRTRRPRPYHGRYGGRRLWRVADRLAEWLEDGDVYAYFNNDFDGHAVADATWLRDRLARSRAGVLGVSHV